MDGFSARKSPQCNVADGRASDIDRLSLVDTEAGPRSAHGVALVVPAPFHRRTDGRRARQLATVASRSSWNASAYRIILHRSNMANRRRKWIGHHCSHIVSARRSSEDRLALHSTT